MKDHHCCGACGLHLPGNLTCVNAGNGNRLSVMCASSTLLYVLSSLPLSVNSTAPCAQTSSKRRSDNTLSGAAVHRSKSSAPAADFSLFNGPLTDAKTERE